MLIRVQTVLLLFAFACSAQASSIRWPNADVPVPTQIKVFIARECEQYRGFSEESVEDCILAEAYGYRAVVTMLVDPEYGDRAVKRYRGCAVGLGDQGGRFHRRKAECLSKAYEIVWRYEFSIRASAEEVPGPVRRLALAGPDRILRDAPDADSSENLVPNGFN